MNLHAQSVTWSRSMWAAPRLPADRRRQSTRDAVKSIGFPGGPVVRPVAAGGLAKPMRIVGMIAFGQTLLFIVFFLFICARAGAATQAKVGFDTELKLSTYITENERDPFGAQSAKSASGVAKSAALSVLKLQGILYQASNPAAMINDRLVVLNKPALLPTEQGELEVKAVEITRETVVLEIGKQKVELRLGGEDREKVVN